MSETKNPGEKKLSVSKLTLKPRTETGVVRQSFSHGRSKQVVVEKVKRRSIGGAAEVKAEPAPVETVRKPAAEAPKPSGVVLAALFLLALARIGGFAFGLVDDFAALAAARLFLGDLALFGFAHARIR